MFSPTSTPPRPRQATTTKRRTAGSKRVYGKRKVDAPRAVFEQRSPPKGVGKVVDDEVDSLEVKMAGISLEGVEGVVQIVKKEEKEEAKDEKETGEEKDAEKSPAQPKEGEDVVEGVKISEAEGHANTAAEDTPEERTEESPKSTLEDTPEETLKDASKDTQNTQNTAKDTKNTNETPRDSPKDTSEKEKWYETMVGIHINTRKSQTGPEQQPQEHNTTTRGKRRTATTTTRTRTKKPAPRLSSGCVQDEKSNEYALPILNEAQSPIAAQGVQKFSSWAARGGNMLQVVKIAEGSYGEVYKMRLREEVCKQEMSKSKLARLRAYGDNVFKVVPLRAAKGPGSKKFTSVEEIVSETRMLKYLDPIPGFARFRDIHVVQGRFPKSFQDAWDYYKKTKDDCLNPNPASKKAYADSQMWAIIEMDDAGCELEKFSWSSVFQIYDIFWGVAMALARAEEYAMFEHRDLHLGNVCIRTTRTDNCMDPPTDLEIISRPYSSGFGLSTLETNIIDYSLSRAEMYFNEDPNAPAEVASSDLDKKQIFDAIGENEDDVFLRDTYRHMRAEVYSGNPANTEKHPDIPGIWSEYAPGTNLVWLGFLLKSLLKNKKPEPASKTATAKTTQRKPLAPCSPNKNITIASDKKPSRKQDNKHSVKQINTAEAQLQATQWKKVLEDRLDTVVELLDMEHRHEDMCCAADLVAYAMDSQWLSEEDFF